MQRRISQVYGVLLTYLLAGPLSVRADDLPFAAPVIAELFTSQGCNSCPPAEALLGDLAKRSDVLPLAFHVTYWNDLGWRDKFSFRGADERQYRYANAMGKRTVYTPQMIVNGERNVLGSDVKEVTRALAAAARVPGIPLSVADGTLRVLLPLIEGGCDCQLLLLGVQPSAQTAIGSGENAGRLLREANIVREIHSLPAWDGKAGLRVQPLPALQSDASLVVLLAQRRSDARIMAAGSLQLAQRPAT